MTTEAFVRHHEPVMGTVVSFAVAPGRLSEQACRAGIDVVAAELRRMDDLFSTWKPESAMSRYRRGELDDRDLPEEITTVLGLCSEVKEASGGWFDPWAMPGGVDPTGLVKGWAVGRAAASLAAGGATGGIVNGGGDIAAFGEDPSGAPWRVGIQHPWLPEALACVIEVRGSFSVATSGLYERGEHLVDPFAAATETETGPPGTGSSPTVVSATVTGPFLAVADGLATALGVGGQAVLDLVAQVGDGYEAYYVLEDGNEASTEKFPFGKRALAPDRTAAR